MKRPNTTETTNWLCEERNEGEKGWWYDDVRKRRIEGDDIFHQITLDFGKAENTIITILILHF